MTLEAGENHREILRRSFGTPQNDKKVVLVELTFGGFVTLMPIYGQKGLATDELRFFTRPFGASFRITRGTL